MPASPPAKFRAAAGGTLKYAAPEQLLGHRIGLSADIFSLGLLMLAVVNGAEHAGRGQLCAPRWVVACVVGQDGRAGGWVDGQGPPGITRMGFSHEWGLVASCSWGRLLGLLPRSASSVANGVAE